MIKSGQIITVNFPDTSLGVGKPRPSLIIAPAPYAYSDWLVCMISSQLHQKAENTDLIIHEKDSDFSSSGLKTSSIIRIGRLAVIDETCFFGIIGEISSQRLLEAKEKIIKWIKKSH